MVRHIMTARRKAALRRAQLASARKRRKHGRINKKIRRTHAKADKRIANQARIVALNHQMATHEGAPVHHFTRRGVVAYNKGVRIHNKRVVKVAKLKAKKRKR
jgi:hypothetical protein